MPLTSGRIQAGQREQFTARSIPVAHGFSGQRGASLLPESKARRQVIAPAPMAWVKPKGFTGIQGLYAPDRKVKQDSLTFRRNVAIGCERRASPPKIRG